MDMWNGMERKIDPRELTVGDLSENTPQMIFTEWHEDLVMVRKQDIRLGVELSPLSLQATVACLDWIIKTGAVLAEAEQARDILAKELQGVEGR